ncbi:GTP-binding protein, partial [Heyndrickxia sporothermodurans]|uniref:GTP-binding protein n=1 Tax=Heyndrickxia sporothermodurans TaxID=46224 RepID=UPI000AC96074
MKKIETYVLNGFLGSGKTTLLLNMLRHYKKERIKVAVILNELGAVNVESHLFGDQSVFELLNGCICCTIQEVRWTPSSRHKFKIFKVGQNLKNRY